MDSAEEEWGRIGSREGSHSGSDCLQHGPSTSAARSRAAAGTAVRQVGLLER